MKKLKLLLIGLFGLIGLSSFCSAVEYASGTYTFSDSNCNGGNLQQVITNFNWGSINPKIRNICLVFSGLAGNTLNSSLNYFGTYHEFEIGLSTSQYSYYPDFLDLNSKVLVNDFGYCGSLYTNSVVNGNVYFIIANPNGTCSYNTTDILSFDYKIIDYSDYLNDYVVPNLSNSCDYSSYESTINSLSGSLSSCNISLTNANGTIANLSGSLATCQSDLISCQNSSSNSSCEATGYISDYVPGNILFSGSKSFSSAGYTNVINYGDNGAGTYCIKFTSSNAQTLSMGFANGGTTAPTNLYSLYNDQYGNWICLYGNKPYLNVKLNASSNTIDYEIYKLTDLLDTQFNCPVNSSPTIDQEYCVSNGLCPSCQTCPTIDQEYCENNFNLISPSNCPVFSGGVSNRSSLFINNIQHLGASNIYMSIPEEISWDYSYSNSGEIMEVDVEGYNVDYDYINGVVNIQKYKPSSEDFTNIIGNLGLYLKILLFLLFAFILISWIRKPFRSKLK